MKYYQFRKWAKEDKPSFKTKDEETNKLSWTLKGVFYNAPKDVVTKEWKNVTIPANVNIVFENEQSVAFSIEWWKLFRQAMHSILNSNIWENIEMYTFINKGWFKSISITNSDKKKKITTKDWKTITVNEDYFWMTKFEHPEVEVINNKKWEYVSSDDSEANEFFITRIRDKFGKPAEWNWEEISVEDIPFS